MDESGYAEDLSERRIARSAEIANHTPLHNQGRRLQVKVLYTTHAGTVAALKVATRLAANLGDRPKVLMLYAVPYTLPLEKPGVPTGFLEERIRALAEEAPMDVTAQVYLCREPRRSLREILRPHSLIVIGGRKRWWPTREHRWARMLRKDGHEVILVDCD
jgi:hypothetical protein